MDLMFLMQQGDHLEKLRVSYGERKSQN